MPGCGKTTIANELKKALNIPCVDTDVLIEQKANKTISDIFKISEDYFRDIEEEVIKNLGIMEASIISTGGGVIKRHSNIFNLKKNGVVFFINRPLEKILEDIEVDNRPLLKDKKNNIIKLYNERISLYKEYADIEVLNDASLEAVVANIIKLYKGCE